ncbi:MAG: hypothetical protein AAGA83_00245 [Cyanobacteria bacterium P01_F01_bin.116]
MKSSSLPRFTFPEKFADYMLRKQSPFCANPKCQYHDYKVTPEHADSLRVAGPSGQNIDIKRCTVSTCHEGKFYLCEICANTLTIAPVIDQSLQSIWEEENSKDATNRFKR